MDDFDLELVLNQQLSNSPPCANSCSPFFEQWLEVQANEPYRSECPIENLYTELHKQVDQVVAALSERSPVWLGQIREQNSRLIDKLTSLENAIQIEEAHYDFGLGPSTATLSSVLTPSQLFNGEPTDYVSSTTPSSNGTSVSHSSPSADNRSSDLSQGNPSPPRSVDTRGRSKLGRKVLQIGNDETRRQASEWAAQLKAPEYQNIFPSVGHFSKVSRITDITDFLRLVSDLGQAIESSTFGEQYSRIKKRIALAHFYYAYALAQDNPSIFLSWCDKQRVGDGRLRPKGGSKSIVQQRFADLIFSSQADLRIATSAVRHVDNGDDIKRRIAKVQMWRKSGKKWAQVIQRFGYGILLLLPSDLADEDLRVAHDKVLESTLDLMESRKHIFEDVLQQSNDLLNAHFFSHEKRASLADAQMSCPFQMAEGYGIMQATTLPS